MFDSFKEKIGLWKANRQEKRNGKNKVERAISPKGIQSVIIGFPDNLSEATDTLQLLKKEFDSSKIRFTFWSVEQHASLIKEKFPKANIISPSDFKYTQWKIPSVSDIQSKFPSDADLVIDLSVDFHLDSVYIWTVLKRPIRIGLYSYDEQQFFDVVLNFKPETTFINKLKKLSEILQNLK